MGGRRPRPLCSGTQKGPCSSCLRCDLTCHSAGRNHLTTLALYETRNRLSRVICTSTARRKPTGDPFSAFPSICSRHLEPENRIQTALPGTWGHVELCRSLSHAHCSWVTMLMLAGVQGHADHPRGPLYVWHPRPRARTKGGGGPRTALTAWRAGWRRWLVLEHLLHSGALKVPLGGTSRVLGWAQPSPDIADSGPSGWAVAYGALVAPPAPPPHTSVFSHFFNKCFGPYILSNMPDSEAILVSSLGTQNSPSRASRGAPGSQDLGATWALSHTHSIQCGDKQVWGGARPLCRPPARHLCGIRDTPHCGHLSLISGFPPGHVSSISATPVYIFTTFTEQRL